MNERFITVEGAEGSGKTTLVQALAERMTSEGADVLVTREPGDGPAGPAIREALLQGVELDAWTEAFLFLADRRQHCESVVLPALESGRWVVCDRFADSTVVYQGYARGLDIEELRRLNALATGGLVPRLTLLLDLPPQVGIARLESKDRLDRQPLDFHRKVREGFLAEAELEPKRWRVLNAGAYPADLLEQAWRAICGVAAGTLS